MQVLESDPANWKALSRPGQAHAAVGDVTRALLDLDAALEAAPTNESSVIEARLEAARRLRAEQTQVWNRSRSCSMSSHQWAHFGYSTIPTVYINDPYQNVSNYLAGTFFRALIF